MFSVGMQMRNWLEMDYRLLVTQPQRDYIHQLSKYHPLCYSASFEKLLITQNKCLTVNSRSDRKGLVILPEICLSLT